MGRKEQNREIDFSTYFPLGLLFLRWYKLFALARYVYCFGNDGDELVGDVILYVLPACACLVLCAVLGRGVVRAGLGWLFYPDVLWEEGSGDRMEWRASV
jgi:hypothetical protein